MAETTPYLVYLPNGQRIIERTTKTQKDWAVAQVSIHCGRYRVERIDNAADPSLIGSAFAVTAERITEEEIIQYSGSARLISLGQH